MSEFVTGMKHFDRKGRASEELEAVGRQISKLAEDFLNKLVNDGGSVVEVRAVGYYLMQFATDYTSSAVVAIWSDIEKEGFKDVDLNLSQSEMDQAKSKDTRVQAMLDYKNRTGVGLKECKDTVTAWLEKMKKETKDWLDELGLMAMRFRSSSEEEREQIAVRYALVVNRLIAGGFWDEGLGFEEELPDKWMPRAYFVYWKMTPSDDCRD